MSHSGQNYFFRDLDPTAFIYPSYSGEAELHLAATSVYLAGGYVNKCENSTALSLLVDMVVQQKPTLDLYWLIDASFMDCPETRALESCLQPVLKNKLKLGNFLNDYMVDPLGYGLGADQSFSGTVQTMGLPEFANIENFKNAFQFDFSYGQSDETIFKTG